ncbi:type II toxin-antitoxin system HipA family toxin [Atopomonas sediminilitoris]|uniref:type II toxin-antitoxin system HipA family toxin n=1 Tax=Atopomonas sediminilitoris TaxID=2919919 RepID=UPI001F4EED58|nr:type II toxin-antitoxin system HipA family toxin [Atopomonas sediminilitoris]MCJ8168327.1 type II toxin-antitoxin system HipA family toxin [Atopomonas sediminilitoris]
MNNVASVEVLLAGTRVGELVSVPRRGTFFAYDEQWLATGFNLSPLNMEFKPSPQAAPDPHLFGGLMGVFADSLPDGWGMLLMDRFFLRERGIDRRAITALDRLAYMGDRAMGALEYRPALEKTGADSALDLERLYQAALEVYEGDTETTLGALRLAGGSPAGARPKVVVALSQDKQRCTSSFKMLAEGYEHWLVKFRSPEEHRDTGAIESAYAQMARNAGVEMAESALLNVPTESGVERFFAAKRFDRDGERKIHMLTACGILYADHRAPSLDYGDLLRATWAITGHAGEVEKMARLMVFNALAHNHDDHSKNFAYLFDQGRWGLSPAYDLTFARVRGMSDEHTTAFAGAGLPTRKALRKVCEVFSFLKVDQYIEQTLDALSGWRGLCRELDIADQQAVEVQVALDLIRARLD